MDLIYGAWNMKNESMIRPTDWYDELLDRLSPFISYFLKSCTLLPSNNGSDYYFSAGYIDV